MQTIGNLRNPNLWSLSIRRGSQIMRAKIEAELDKSQRREPGERIDPVAEERKLLEFLVKFSGTPNPATSALAEEMENALKACGYVVRRVKIKALSRGLVGASASYGKIPFEVGLSFDSFLNVPYIPGSTIKGAVRSGVYEILLRSGRQEADADQICGRLFGDRGSIGLIGFTDAYPVKAGVKEYLLYPDVMTPHYTDDTKNELEVRPNPVTFLTIAPSTTFQFYMFYRKGRGERLLRVGTGLDADLAENPVAEISSLGVVDMGLLYSFYRGVGAKTSVGYSRFEVVEYTKV